MKEEIGTNLTSIDSASLLAMQAEEDGVQGAHEARLGHELVAPQLPRFESPRLFSVVLGREGC